MVADRGLRISVGDDSGWTFAMTTMDSNTIRHHVDAGDHVGRAARRRHREAEQEAHHVEGAPHGDDPR